MGREVGEGLTLPVKKMEKDPQVAATIEARVPSGQTYSDGKENGLWAVPNDEWRSREEIDKYEWVPAGELVGENNTESAILGESLSAGSGTSATASTRNQNGDKLLENVTDIGDPPIRQGSYRQEEGQYYPIIDAP